MTPTPLLLLHAFPLDHRLWDDVVAALPPGQPVVAPDVPDADVLGGRPSLEDAADRVAAQLHAAGHARVVVAGLSMGGYVALALAERHPGLVAGLGLLDTRSTADAPEAAARRLATADAVDAAGSVDPVRGAVAGLLGGTTRTGRPQVEERVGAWVDEQPPARVAWSQRAMASRPDRTPVLRAFAGPVLVVVGAEDEVTGPEHAQHMAAASATARLVVVPGAGHLTAVEAPAPVAAALAELVARTDATPPR
ncbi:alpha/beta fold hydrolase [Cellulomonas sp. SLBN-39]|uniref:alpha/beta fold hydrolase n=1 Tax=Cellulomonas sp. SLBN-39 TaxID=2768446 RepID=UPI00114E72DF|nr:alpha/beta fold hydrolase [Cellulomonas sp. SLBN-39]TQL01241.1 pimeloyl-ACP methyl ester carboxylesterase [Cellulomonas sp. SLBN-39]